MKCLSAALSAIGAAALPAFAAAQIAVAVFPPRTAVSLTAYGDADLTLVRETRHVYLPEGVTDLALEWPGAAVDASSVILTAPYEVKISPSAQPPRKGDQLVWRLECPYAGERDLEVAYLASGIEWRPSYRLTLNEAAGSVDLEGLVNLRNRSGQEFENVALQLAVGDLRLISNPAEAAWKALPAYRDERKGAPPSAGSGLSERTVYDLNTLARLPLSDNRVLPFFPKTTIKAQVVYRLHEAKYGAGVHPFIVFTNATEAGLGRVPLARADAWISAIATEGPLPRGRVTLPYTPIGEDCEVDLGPSKDVLAERRVVGRKRTDFEFDRFGAVEGYDDRQEIELKISNWSVRPIAFEYTETVPGVWEVASDAPYKEERMNEVVFKFTLAPQTTRALDYRLLLRQGKRVRLGPTRPK